MVHWEEEEEEEEEKDEKEVEEEERLARNLCNQGCLVDISDGSVKIRITINGDSLMTKDDALVKS